MHKNWSMYIIFVMTQTISDAENKKDPYTDLGTYHGTRYKKDYESETDFIFREPEIPAIKLKAVPMRQKPNTLELSKDESNEPKKVSQTTF